MPSSGNHKRERQKKPSGVFVRFTAGTLGIFAVVLLCMGATRLMPKPGLPAGADAESGGEAAATDEATLSPVPTLTPTPAAYAPFGAQYGYGGEELLPQTPTPEPTATPEPEPTPEPDAQGEQAVAADAPAAEETPLPVAETAPATLRRGSKGEDVVRLQSALIELGYLDGKADGDFGAKTTAAVVAFQAVNGLSADGIAGEQTQAALYGGAALSADQAPPQDFLVLVNRENKVGKDYVPSDLVNIADVIPSDVLKVKYKGTKANRTACEALYKMLQDAIDEGIGDWQVSSAYRTYQGQQELVEEGVAGFKERNPDWSRQRCLSATYQTTAPAGTSEHQTGLAFDITVPGVSFAGTEQQKWLHKHCYEYGFVVRFTEEKQKITGFLAEAWHIRYVGTQAAAVMTFNNWCLEEYVEAML